MKVLSVFTLFLLVLATPFISFAGEKETEPTTNVIEFVSLTNPSLTFELIDNARLKWMIDGEEENTIDLKFLETHTTFSTDFYDYKILSGSTFTNLKIMDYRALSVDDRKVLIKGEHEFLISLYDDYGKLDFYVNLQSGSFSKEDLSIEASSTTESAVRYYATDTEDKLEFLLENDNYLQMDRDGEKLGNFMLVLEDEFTAPVSGARVKQYKTIDDDNFAYIQIVDLTDLTPEEKMEHFQTKSNHLIVLYEEEIGGKNYYWEAEIKE